MYSDKVNILFVDDEPDVLNGFRRMFRRGEFKVYTSTDPRAALDMVANEGPFTVVVSDMHMPDLDGLNFLRKVKEIDPDTVGVILTGNSQVETAIDAVNEGDLFRYLTKPCSSEAMAKTIFAAVQKHQMALKDKDELDKTIERCVGLLIELLTSAMPDASVKAKRVRRLAAQAGRKLGYSNPRQLDVAAALAHIGLTAVPDEIRRKVFSGAILTPLEEQLVRKHPKIGEKLVAKIPQLKLAGFIIRHQEDIPQIASMDVPLDRQDRGTVGALILRTAIHLESLICENISAEDALGILALPPRDHHPEALEAFKSIHVPDVESYSTEAKLSELEEGMFLLQDVRAKDGSLVAEKGHEVSPIVMQRLKRYLGENMIDSSTVRVSREFEVTHVAS